MNFEIDPIMHVRTPNSIRMRLPQSGGRSIMVICYKLICRPPALTCSYEGERLDDSDIPAPLSRINDSIYDRLSFIVRNLLPDIEFGNSKQSLFHIEYPPTTTDVCLPPIPDEIKNNYFRYNSSTIPLLEEIYCD